MNLELFKYNQSEIRVVLDENQNPLFVAKDICNVLGLTNVTMALAKLDDDEKGVKPIDTLGGEQSMTVITESGLYTLIMRSNKPEAKKFRKWVTGEVLPTIRKTGGYGTMKTGNPLIDSLVEHELRIKSLEQQQQRLDVIEAEVKEIAKPNRKVLPKEGYDSINRIAKQVGLSNNVVKKIIAIVKPKSTEATTILEDGTAKVYRAYKIKPIRKFAKQMKKTAVPVGKRNVYFRSPLVEFKFQLL